MKLVNTYEAINEELYKKEIDSLKDKDGKWTTKFSYKVLIERLTEIITTYKKDGQDIYEQFVSEINETNYPTEIKEKLLTDVKNDLFSKALSKEEDFLQHILEENKKNIAEAKKQKKEIKKIENALKSLGLSKNIFFYKLREYNNTNEIKEKLSTLPLDIQKSIIKIYRNTLGYFATPSKELCLYAIKETHIDLWDIPEKYRKDIDIQLALVEKTHNIPVKEMNLQPQAKIEYIKKYPAEIITEITTKNFNNKNRFTIYDLNHEELEVYKKALGEYIINKVKENPTYIKEIKNPSEIVKETALKAFKEQYVR